MKIVQRSCNGDISYPFSHSKEQILFFDIETTGFSPKTSALYLIGVLYYQNDQWHTLQWFADDSKSEKELLISFFAFLKNYSCIIHFNGSGFDIPYLEKKCIQHELTGSDYTFSHVESMDLYKRITPCKKRLLLENCKQKTVEHFLHIYRKDPYTGGELIRFYQHYRKQNEPNTKEAHQTEEILLLHNYEDLAGMLQFSNTILYLTDLLNGTLSLEDIRAWEEDGCLLFTATLPFSLNSSYHWKCEDALLGIKQTSLTLILPIYHCELRHFYSNYKDYYYLPEEDTAIHKSVAVYVDKSFRQKAKKENCYTRQEGSFIPVYTDALGAYFQETFSSSQHFLLLDENFFTQKESLQLYLQTFLKNRSDLLLAKDPTL